MTDPLAFRVALRFASSQALMPDYVEAVLRLLDQSNAPDAYRILQGLAKSLRHETIAPITDIFKFLQERGVPQDEIELVRNIKPKKPREKKTLSFTDAFILFGREASVSVIPDMRFENDPDAAATVLSWLAGYKKLKPIAKNIWNRAVKKVHFGKPRGSEDASWLPGGALFLTVSRREVSPVSASSMLTHELGHAFEEIHRIQSEPWNPDIPWGKPPFISDYAESRPAKEDVPESFASFVLTPAFFRAKCPEKYDALKKLI